MQQYRAYCKGNDLTKKQKGFEGFIKLCLNCSNENALVSLFGLFFTDEEREDLALRYLIVKDLLQQEKSQREIAKSCKVSIAKVTRGSNILKQVDKKLITFLKKHYDDA